MSDREGRDIGKHGRALVLVFVGLLLSQPFAAVFAAIPVAIYTLRGRSREGFGFVIVAALAGAAGLRSLGGALGMGLAAATGYGIGFGLRLWSFGWTVAVTTALLFSVSCLGLIAGWSEIPGFVREKSVKAEQVLREAESGSAASAAAEAEYKLWEWATQYWPNALFGLTLFGALVSVCFVVSFTANWVRFRDQMIVTGSFRTMRPPEWLVWLVILAAGLAYANYQSPTDWMRLVSWNALIGLSSVYWINGISVFVFGIAAWKPHPLLSIAIVIGIVSLQLGSLFMVLGLFDTWGEFRTKIERWQTARTATDDSDDEQS